MKKKIYIIIGITLFLVAAIFATREIIQNIQMAEEERQQKEKAIEENRKMEEKVKTAVENLSDEAKKALNYDELLADIKSAPPFVYAKQKKIDNSSNYLQESKFSLPDINADCYYGNGYYIKDEGGGECIQYGYYSTVDHTRIYGIMTLVPFEGLVSENNDTGIIDSIEKHPYETAAIVVVSIGLISCIIVYIKNKKEQSK